MSNLKRFATALSAWARQGACQSTVQHSGRIRTIADNVGIALLWMSKGGPNDDRTLAKRMTAGNFYWRLAVRAALAKVQA